MTANGAIDDLITIEDVASPVATIPRWQRRGIPVEIARSQLAEALDEFMADATAFNRGEAPRTTLNIVEPLPPHKTIKITTGAGKSVSARKMIARFVAAAKAEGQPHRILYLVPTHDLGNEARTKMPAGISTALWQGRDGTKAGTDEPMCRNLEAVKAALSVGSRVETAACRKSMRGKDPILCTHYATCAYQIQKAAVREADVVIAAHEIAFNVPEAIGDGFGFVFIDEAFWQSGITATTRIAIGGLTHELRTFPVRDRRGLVDAGATDNLRDLLERLQRALEASPDGYVTIDMLTAQGLTKGDGIEPGSCGIAKRLEWLRKVDTGLSPDSSQERVRQLRERFGFMGQIQRRAAMWAALEELIVGGDNGRLIIESKTTNEGTIRWLHVLGRKDIHFKISELPLLHADATMEVALVRKYLPNARIAIDVEVDAPHMTITQVVGLSVGKSSLQALPTGIRRGSKVESGEQAESRVSRKRQRLVEGVKHLVGKLHGLVITYKAIVDDFRQLDRIEVGHFNAIGGIDRWGNADVAVTIGRPLPSPEDIARITAALFGKAVGTGLPGRAALSPIKVVRHVELASGGNHTIEALIYEDASADMVRKAVTEAEIIQAIGRVRGVNRTADNTVQVFMVLSDTLIDLPLDAVIDFGSIEPDRFDQMLARGIVPQMPRDASRMYPDMFATWNAAKMAYRQNPSWTARISKPGSTPNKNISIRVRPQFRVRYRTSGRGSVPRLALFDRALISDPRAALEAALGQIDLFELADVNGYDNESDPLAKHLTRVPSPSTCTDKDPKFGVSVANNVPIMLFPTMSIMSVSPMRATDVLPGYFFGHHEPARRSGLRSLCPHWLREDSGEL